MQWVDESIGNKEAIQLAILRFDRLFRGLGLRVYVVVEHSRAETQLEKDCPTSSKVSKLRQS